MKSGKMAVIIMVLPIMLAGCDVPQARFASTTHDFGQTEQNRELRHVFRFTNAGGSPLIIHKIHPG